VQLSVNNKIRLSTLISTINSLNVLVYSWLFTVFVWLKQALSVPSVIFYFSGAGVVFIGDLNHRQA